jgi:hypothetical protein
MLKGFLGRNNKGCRVNIIHLGDIASVFLHKGPHLIARHLLSLNRLNLDIVNLLCSLTGGSNDAYDCIVCQSSDAADASQTAPFTMRLQDLANLLWSHLTMVIQRVKSLIERLLTLRAVITLATIGSFTVFMGIRMTAQKTFHGS